LLISKPHAANLLLCVIPMGMIACLLEVAMEMLEKLQSGKWTIIAKPK